MPLEALNAATFTAAIAACGGVAKWPQVLQLLQDAVANTVASGPLRSCSDMD